MNIRCLCGKKIIVTNPSKIGRTKYCSKNCFYKFRTRKSGLKYQIKVKNSRWFKKGFTPWNKGKPGNYLSHWKGNKVGYDAIHGWVERWLGKPKQCENCGSNKNLQWSNKSGKYKREAKDWQRLCAKCHQQYDYKMFGARKKFYT